MIYLKCLVILTIVWRLSCMTNKIIKLRLDKEMTSLRKRESTLVLRTLRRNIRR